MVLGKSLDKIIAKKIALFIDDHQRRFATYLSNILEPALDSEGKESIAIALGIADAIPRSIKASLLNLRI